MNFIYLLGRFHVLVLHLPIGIILVAITLEFVARKDKYRQLESAAPFLWAAAAVTAILTVSLGYAHYFEGGFEGETAIFHMITGTSVAVFATLAWFLVTRFKSLYARVKYPIAGVLVVLVVLAGHYGGNLTHGATYLVEYAPQPIRSLAGLEPRRPPVTDLAMADPYLDVVRPMLRARCSSCHSNDRQRGELNLSTHETLMEGGESGRAIVSGEAGRSRLYNRITLAQDHEDFMPAEGKTPLTAQETEIIGWWIDAGVPTDTTIGELDIEEVRPLLEDVLGL